MTWESKTGQFGTREMGMLDAGSAADLADALLSWDPLVALRALAEVMLNGDNEKLNKLLQNSVLVAHWRQYDKDKGLDNRDKEYASRLNDLLA